jgi:hypothetical protein
MFFTSFPATFTVLLDLNVGLCDSLFSRLASLLFLETDGLDSLSIELEIEYIEGFLRTIKPYYTFLWSRTWYLTDIYFLEAWYFTVSKACSITSIRSKKSSWNLKVPASNFARSSMSLIKLPSIVAENTAFCKNLSTSTRNYVSSTHCSSISIS